MTDRQHELQRLCHSYNEATCPWKLLTDHQHRRIRQWARAIRNRMRRLGFRDMHDYYETAGGTLRIVAWRTNE
jgi:hypothetical protein